MNKHEMIDAVSAMMGANKVHTETTIDAILQTVTQALTRGETVQLV